MNKEKTLVNDQQVNLFLLEKLAPNSRKIARLIEEDKYVRQNFTIYQALTRREKEIVTLLLKGFNNPMIAEKLFISRHTVEQHRKNINTKLSVSSYADLYKFGYAFDMV